MTPPDVATIPVILRRAMSLLPLLHPLVKKACCFNLGAFGASYAFHSRVVLENINMTQLASDLYLSVHSYHRRATMIPTTPAQERYTRFSCPNPQCARFSRPGEGNIAHRSWTGTRKHIERLRCTACDREFSEREGTLMARSKLPEDTVIQLVKCQRWGVCDEGTADICAVDRSEERRVGKEGSR